MMLVLPIKKQWFDMIKKGEKREEYREITPYYISRFLKFDDGKIHTLLLRNGYSKNSPTIKIRFTIKIGTGFVDWGAVEDKNYFVLKIFEVLEGEE